jgi:hypothetical protein
MSDHPFDPRTEDEEDQQQEASLQATATATATVGAGGQLVRSGTCSLGGSCTAKNQELSDQYRCRHCNRQLHGFISGCSQAKNPKDFRDGVMCKVQPCYTESKASAGRPDGAVSSFVLN